LVDDDGPAAEPAGVVRAMIEDLRQPAHASRGLWFVVGVGDRVIAAELPEPFVQSDCQEVAIGVGGYECLVQNRFNGEFGTHSSDRDEGLPQL
jgi:hypothetical protein